MLPSRPCWQTSMFPVTITSWLLIWQEDPWSQEKSNWSEMSCQLQRRVIFIADASWMYSGCIRLVLWISESLQFGRNRLRARSQCRSSPERFDAFKETRWREGHCEVMWRFVVVIIHRFLFWAIKMLTRRWCRPDGTFSPCLPVADGANGVIWKHKRGIKCRVCLWVRC